MIPENNTITNDTAAIKIPGLDTYYGGKEASGVYQAIINQIPPHKVYVEPFLGRGTILRLKKPAEFNFAFEIDPDIYQLWAGMKPFPFYFNIWNECGIKRLSRVLNALGHNNYKTFVYLDPPYLIETRSTPKARYKFEFTREQHIQLLTLANNLNCNVAISCYDNELYSTMLPGWRKINWTRKNRRGTAIETLYMNYPEPTELHDYRYIGDNYRERDRIQQKIKRHVQRLKLLPAHERNAIIEAIKNKV